VLVVVILGSVGRWLPVEADIPVSVAVSFVVTAHVTGSAAGSMSRLLGAKPLVWLGLVSYSLYLWHLPLVVVAAEVWGLDRLGTAAFAVPTAIVLAELTRRFVELPMARVKERWVRTRPVSRPSSAPATAALE
jgi:peptidoglycan/LPS O-acetylase OafA/YrhL